MLRVAKVILAVFILNTVFKSIFGRMVFGFMVCWSFVSWGRFMVGGSGFVSGSRFMVGGGWFMIHWCRFMVNGSRFMVSGSGFMVCGHRWRWGRFISGCGWWHISGSGCRLIFWSGGWDSWVMIRHGISRSQNSKGKDLEGGFSGISGYLG